MIRHIMGALFAVALRILLAVAGLVFLLSLLLAALLLLALWSLRALWAQLSGRPVAGWTFKVNRQAIWDRFYRPASRSAARSTSDTDVIDVQAKEKKSID